ncbi:MAG: patatin-like phospholipase family protein [Pseudomonadales bacterium]|nr:patatin-like phospholipase family protein [Pseudomonadales bacterium]
MSALSIYAGPVAFKRLQQEGIHPDQFKVLLGASGGPKWFVLYGLDRVLFGDFLQRKSGPLNTLGSSAGAWRLCCLATADPLRAIDELARRYSGQTYTETPTVEEVTTKMRDMLQDVLGPDGAGRVINNDRVKTHIVADRCKGFGGSHTRALQTVFLGMSALANAVSRKTLSWFFQRTLFTNAVQESPWRGIADIDTALVALTEANLLDALIASGSIPFVLEGVRDIVGAKPGLYWDGGITDYHFDLPFCAPTDLVLYPHFSPRVIPGWFDKKLWWRKPHTAHFDNVVLLVPSHDFVSALPNRKIPDRSDFVNYTEAERLEIWDTVLRESGRLGEEFQQLVDSGAGLDNMRLLDRF